MALWVCGWARKAYMECCCPHCDDHRQVPVCDHTVTQLFNHGVVVCIWDIPHEVEDPQRNTDRPPFTNDDYLDWALALKEAEYIVPVPVARQRTP